MSTSTARHGESGHIPKRQLRFYKSNDDWFVATREAPIGPYANLREAIDSAKNYQRYLKQAQFLRENFRKPSPTTG